MVVICEILILFFHGTYFVFIIKCITNLPKNPSKRREAMDVSIWFCQVTLFTVFRKSFEESIFFYSVLNMLHQSGVIRFCSVSLCS